MTVWCLWSEPEPVEAHDWRHLITAVSDRFGRVSLSPYARKNRSCFYNRTNKSHYIQGRRLQNTIHVVYIYTGLSWDTQTSQHAQRAQRGMRAWGISWGLVRLHLTRRGRAQNYNHYLARFYWPFKGRTEWAIIGRMRSSHFEAERTVHSLSRLCNHFMLSAKLHFTTSK